MSRRNSSRKKKPSAEPEPSAAAAAAPGKPKKKRLPPIRFLPKKPLPRTRVDWCKYWEAQHQDPFECTEALQSFEALKRFLFRFVCRESKVLIVGCGNSRLGEALYDCGITNITSIDCSKSVIHLMQLRNRSEGRLSMKFQVMDYCNMPFPDRSFDIVLDKNVLDVLMSIPKDENKAATDAVRHVARVLKPGGVYMMLSYAKSSTRFPILGWREDPDFCYRFTPSMPWTNCAAVKIRKTTAKASASEWALEEDVNHFFYTCEKKGGPGQQAARLYPEQHEALQKRLEAAVAGALEEVSDDDGLFDDDDDDDGKGGGKKAAGEKKEGKELTEEEKRAAALEKGRKSSQMASSFFGEGYLKEPPKWG
jgi:SAM-dependent methyltransferase